jgi:hypothetical protein
MAGYSGTPLAKKLGIREGHRVALVGAPEGFEAKLAPLPEGVRLSRRAQGRLDVVLFFSRSEADLVDRFFRLKERLEPVGGLWIAWPKKASGVATDLSFDAVQRVGLAAGLVDNKVCAVDETWSGLRFVYRLKDRPPTSARGSRDPSARRGR